MKTLKLLAALLLISVFGFSQTHTFCPLDGTCTWTAPQTGTFLNVRDCGLDGVKASATDNGPLINTCISNAVAAGNGVISLPAGILTIGTAINLTNRTGLTILGNGTDHYGHVAEGWITELKCNTGNVCVDMTGASSVLLKNLALRLANTYSTPSTIGILQGRTASNGGTCSSENNRFERVNIWTDFSNTVNAGKGYVGIYNVGAEVSKYDGIYINAQAPMIFAALNDYGFASPYVTLQSVTCGSSMTAVEIAQSSIEHNGGIGIEARTTADFTLTDVVLIGTNANSGNTAFSPILLAGSYATNWNATIHVEGLKASNSLIVLAATTIDKNRFVVNVGGSVSDAAAYIAFAAAGQTAGSNYFAFDTHNEGGNQRTFISNAAAETINGGEFHLSGTKSPLNASNITLNGTIVRASGFTDGNVTFNAGSQYSLFSDSGVSLRQNAKLTGSLTIGASGSAISDSRELIQSGHSCGTTSTCANTANGSYRMIFGSVALSSASPSTVTVSGISPAFTSTSTYFCTFSPEGATAAIAAGGVAYTKVSGSSFTITGPNTVTTVIDYRCTGN